MNKLLLLLLLTLSITSVSGQEKWRTLTFGVSNGINHEYNTVSQFNIALDYELNNNFLISSWNGVSYTLDNDSAWMSSQTTIDKRIGNFTLGAGYLYTTYQENALTLPSFNRDDLYFLVKLKLRIKL